MRVALADDSALFRSGLALLLEAAAIEVTLQARTGDELLARLAAHSADVAIVDMRMPPTYTDEGLRTAAQIRRHHPGIGVLVLSTYAETAAAVELLTNSPGAVGYLLKDRVDDVNRLVDALDRIAAGETVVDPDIVRRLVARHDNSNILEQLAPREREVLEHMALGRSNLGISREMYLSPKTVEKHIASLFTRLGLTEDSSDNRRVLAVLTWLREVRSQSSSD
jgi:DNA-binding NarL/FixJ family response regulator